MQLVFTKYKPLILYFADGILPDTEGVSPAKMVDLIQSSNGKIFSVIFNKRTNGDLREMRARLGVKSYLKGGELPYSPSQKRLIPVWDVEKQEYRMINIKGIISVNIGGQQYSLTSSGKKALIKRIDSNKLSIINLKIK